ncbi:phosphonate C-P lyase system protein PhnH [Bacillus thermotolerans]|uniref:PhnH protein n=1 Tax=Bacillus thermotolerans TaxID=1221996 RepID=A0A0F5I610_BACTR|nr:phosphonate C-P lyase system protein PhnH [Bacillus thermotolerans]KKB40710.1 PhnH protein [Bacillus thermotolerans]
MKLDLVHDIQTAYRKVIDSMSRPGTVSDISDEASKVAVQTDSFPSTAILALMFLDTEVTFKVFSRREEEVTKWINGWTYAKAVEADEADFLFVLADADEVKMKTAIDAAKAGTLMNPHESAVLIMETDELNAGTELVLTGPGIQEKQLISVPNASAWMNKREEKNSEYPLGVDFIFTDAEGYVLCLPRTTQVREKVMM